MTLKTPKSLQEAILYYSSEVVCVEFLVNDIPVTFLLEQVFRS